MFAERYTGTQAHRGDFSSEETPFIQQKKIDHNGVALTVGISVGQPVTSSSGTFTSMHMYGGTCIVHTHVQYSACTNTSTDTLSCLFTIILIVQGT